MLIVERSVDKAVALPAFGVDVEMMHTPVKETPIKKDDDILFGTSEDSLNVVRTGLRWIGGDLSREAIYSDDGR